MRQRPITKHRPTTTHRPTRSRPRALRIVLALGACLTLLLAGCGARPTVDTVTVTAGGASVTLPAALACFSPAGGTELRCAGGENDDAAPHLAIKPGTDVTIDVPHEVGDTPWVVVISYTDAQGQTQGDRTSVFAPESRYTYTISPPAGAQLTRIEVQSLTAAPATEGGLQFPATGTWVLVVDSDNPGDV